MIDGVGVEDDAAQPRQGVERGGLTGPGGAGDADDITGVSRQAQAGKDRLFPIGEGEFFQRHIFLGHLVSLRG